jgi:hypothetical protein
MSTIGASGVVEKRKATSLWAMHSHTSHNFIIICWPTSGVVGRQSDSGREGGRKGGREEDGATKQGKSDHVIVVGHQHQWYKVQW